ncbi:hypothetical protein HNP47_000864 [Brevundimonas vesicularis]|uniref:Fibronectin type-III domain-containing protein n=1 Tax=Brevundimonas vesicularis TaxID=41276 RepID=A0A7W9FST3_BREVE|nr:hypothetical protein [Brevundimonas vesicularis]MBB5770895.1 hypothetical protein [Brevundimonas vesicularis]
MLDGFLKAAGGRYAEIAGQIAFIHRAAPRAPVFTVRARDTAGPVEIDTASSKLNRFNTVRPRFWSEANEWEMTALPEVTATEWQIEDGQGVAVKRTRGADYTFVVDPKQTRELASLEISNSREGIKGRVPLRPYMDPEPGNTFIFDEPDFALSNLKCFVLDVEDDTENDTVVVTFETETDGKYPYAYGQTGSPPPAQELDPIDPFFVTPPGAGDWTITPRPPSNGAQLPGFDLTGFVSNSTATAIIVETGPSANGPWKQAYQGPPTVTNIPIDGLQPGATYFIAIQYQRNQNYSEREVFGPFTAPDLIAGDLSPESPVRIAVTEITDRLVGVEQISATNAAAVADLEEVFGDTVSAAASAAQAAEQAAVATQAKADALISSAAASEQAAVAIQQALNAETQAGNAQIWADQSAGSATTASSAAATSTEQAGLSATARGEAEGFAGAAFNYRNQASGFVTDAEAAAAVSTAQKLEAIAARDIATEKATASAQSASNASASETAASQQAAAATQQALNAQTQAGNAEVWASQASASSSSAAASESNAAGSASTAASQAVLSASSAFGAASSANSPLATSPALSPDAFSVNDLSTLNGAPNLRQVLSDNPGKIYPINSTVEVNNFGSAVHINTAKALARPVGHRFRYSARIKRMAEGGDASQNLVSLFAWYWDESGNPLGGEELAGVNPSGSDGVVLLSVDHPPPAEAAWTRTLLRVISRVGVTAILSLDTQDIESEKTASAAATASVASAAVASTRADEAGQSASAATAEKLAAELARDGASAAASASATNAAQALASRNQAGEFASSSSGSANTAETAAGHALAYRDQSASSAATANAASVSSGVSASTAEAAKQDAEAARDVSISQAAAALTQAANAGASASSASISANLAASLGANASVINNGRFLNWPAGQDRPTGWDDWTNATGSTNIQSGSGWNGRRFTRMNYVPSMGSLGMKQVISGFRGAGAYNLEVEIAIPNGGATGTGFQGAGVLIQCMDGNGGYIADGGILRFATDPDTGGNVAGSGSGDGRIYRFTKRIDLAPNTASIQLYLMSRWAEGFGPQGANETKSLDWYSTALTSMSEGDRAVPALAAQLNVTAAVAADVATRMASVEFSVTGGAGGDPFDISLKAGPTGSDASITATKVRLRNIVNGEAVEALRIENGKSKFFGDVEVNGGSMNFNNRFIVAQDGTTTIRSGQTGERMWIEGKTIRGWYANGQQAYQLG